MGVYVALMRGLNVGKSTRIAMRDLVPLFEDYGCEQVKSYVQSGNVVFRIADDAIDELPGALQTTISDRLGVRTWIVLRDLEAMRETVANNPFADLDAPPTSIAVAFSRDRIAASGFEYVGDPEAIPDRVQVVGNDIYLYLPNGFSGSKFSPKFFNRDLGATTTRNWRTVTKLLEMMQGVADTEE